MAWYELQPHLAPTFVTHLECSLTGERTADQLHGLSRAGRPLLVRYDLGRSRVLPRAMMTRPTDQLARVAAGAAPEMSSASGRSDSLMPIANRAAPRVLVRTKGGCR